MPTREEYEADLSTIEGDEFLSALTQRYHIDREEAERDRTMREGVVFKAKGTAFEGVKPRVSMTEAPKLGEFATEDPVEWSKRIASKYIDENKDSPTLEEDAKRIVGWGNSMASFRAKYPKDVDLSVAALRKKEVQEAGFLKKAGMVVMAGLDEGAKWATLGARDDIRKALEIDPETNRKITAEYGRSPDDVPTTEDISVMRGAVAEEMPLATQVAETLGSVIGMPMLPVASGAVAKGLIRAGMSQAVAAKVAPILAASAYGGTTLRDPVEGMKFGAFTAIAGPIARKLRAQMGDGFFSRGGAEAVGFTSASSLMSMIQHGEIDLDTEIGNALSGFALGGMSRGGSYLTRDGREAQSGTKLGSPKVSETSPQPPGGTTLGSGLGGVTPEIAGGAAKIVGFPRRAVEKVLTSGDKAVVKTVGKIKEAIERFTGETFRDTPGPRSTIQEEVYRFGGAKRAGREESKFALKDLSTDDAGKGLSREASEEAFKYLTGEGDRAKVESLAGKKYAALADKWRARLDANEKELRDLGRLSDETYDKYVGKWLPRRFRTIEEAKDHPAFGKGGVNPGRVYQRQELSPERLEQLGEIRDPAATVAHGLAIQEQMIAGLRFMRKMATDPRLSSDTPFKGFTDDPLPSDSGRYGDLAGKYVHPKLARDLKGIVGTKDGGLAEFAGHFLDGVMSDWKLATTAGNPATHVRNLLGMRAMKELDHYSDLDPANLVHARDAIKTLRAGRDSTIVINGKPVSARELKLEALKQRITSTDFASTEILDLAEQVELYAGKSWNQKFKKYFHDKGRLLARGHYIQGLPGVGDAAHLASRLYAMEDSVTKVGSFIKKVREGMSYDEAGKSVRDAYQTFGEGFVPRIQQKIGPLGRALGPQFLSFPEQMIRILSKASVEKPVTTAVVVSGFISALQAITRAAGLSDEDVKNLQAILPEWMEPGLIRPVVSADKAKGEFSINDLSYTVPLGNEIEEMRRTMAGDSRQVVPFGFSPGPFATAAYEWMSGQKLYAFGKNKSYLPPGASEGEVARLKKKRLLENVLPSNPMIPGSRPYNRLSETEESEKGAARLSKFGGITIRDVNIGEESDRALRSLIVEQSKAVQRLRRAEDEEQAELRLEIKARADKIREIQKAKRALK